MIRAALVNDNIVSFVQPSARMMSPDRARHHFRMFVAGELRRRTDHAVIRVPIVMKYRPTARSSPHQLDLLGARRPRLSNATTESGSAFEQAQIGFEPWVLIPADDDTRAVDVEEKNGRVGGGLLQKVMFDGEVEEGVVRAGDVDLVFERRVGNRLCNLISGEEGGGVIS